MEKKMAFNRTVPLLIIIGIVVNFLGVKLVGVLGIPIFFDSIGTIFVAVVGGYFPGIVVGFFSNVINGVSDPITLYYGIISVLIACSAAYMARRGVFSSPLRSLIALPVFSLIGGGLGSALTWLLYGFNFGQGISAPFSLYLHNTIGMGKFYAQFIADMCIDIMDKFVAIIVVFIVIHLIKDTLLMKFPYGNFVKEKHGCMSDSISIKKYYRIQSLRSKFVISVISMTLIISSITITVSYIIYSNTMDNRYTEMANSVTDVMLNVLPADQLNSFLANRTETDEYLDIQAQLTGLKDSFPDIEYMYVYKIRNSGCHVIFDIDTEEVKGNELGEVVPFDETFLPYKKSLVSGKKIEPILSNDSFGWLLTVYKPVISLDGNTVAYAAVDISMEDVITDRYVYVIKMLSIVFGAIIIIIGIALILANKLIINPINAMTEAAEEFAYESKDARKISKNTMETLNIRTGDEIENLHKALNKTINDVSEYIDDIDEQARVITQMQYNIIKAFADMVESRDENTGEHIKHTANYVDIISKQLKKDGYYDNILTPEYMDDMVTSAPLHDIGKIKIPDAILNKPGKLTYDEFELMKTHTSAGRSILENAAENLGIVSYLAMATDMAEYHHEWWNGKGYPHGISGTDIPLSARVMAVADVFDALTSKRSYKDAFSYEKAFEIIEEESGTHFDPTIIKAFTEAKAEVIQYLNGMN